MSQPNDSTIQTLIEALKAIPPVVVTSVHFIFDVPLNHWVLIATLIYTLLQTYLALEKRFGKRGRDD